MSSYYSPGDSIRIIYEVNAGTGTLSICVLGTEKDISIKISKNGVSDLHHIFPRKAAVIPLTFGNGEYSLEAALYITPNAIEHIWRTTFSVQLENALIPYLSASSIVNWSPEMALVGKAQSLVTAEDSKATALAIGSYIADRYTYQSRNLPPTYLPDLNDVFAGNTGMCYDFAALYAAMCRSVGIPTRLVMGYSDYVGRNKYHAWCQVYVDGLWLTVDPTYSIMTDSAFLDASYTVGLKYY